MFHWSRDKSVPQTRENSGRKQLRAGQELAIGTALPIPCVLGGEVALRGLEDAELNGHADADAKERGESALDCHMLGRHILDNQADVTL